MPSPAVTCTYLPPAGFVIPVCIYKLSPLHLLTHSLEKFAPHGLHKPGSLYHLVIVHKAVVALGLKSA